MKWNRGARVNEIIRWLKIKTQPLQLEQKKQANIFECASSAKPGKLKSKRKYKAERAQEMYKMW